MEVSTTWDDSGSQFAQDEAGPYSTVFYRSLCLSLCCCVITVHGNLLQMEPMIRDSAHSLLEKFGEVAGTGKTLNMTE